jgi:hypothetical protein
MAQFRGTLLGQRGAVSRLGSKKSGLVALVDGWHKGIRVIAWTAKDGQDHFTVWRTGGSSGDAKPDMIADI